MSRMLSATGVPPHAEFGAVAAAAAAADVVRRHDVVEPAEATAEAPDLDHLAGADVGVSDANALARDVVERELVESGLGERVRLALVEDRVVGHGGLDGSGSACRRRFCRDRYRHAGR